MRIRLYKQYTDILASRHSNLDLLIKIIGDLGYKIPIWDSVEDAVVYAVIGQMLSTPAANSIIKKLSDSLGSSKKIICWASQNADKPGPLMGVSQRKRRALGEWAAYAKTNKKACVAWSRLPLNEYRNEVKKIWGFGDWAADMMAIFHLGRMDVWPQSDAGIERACKIVFEKHERSRIVNYVNGCESIAALYLWELLNRKLISDYEKRTAYG